ncbi:MAG: hypothetical protein HRU46_02490 [Verrucomicrobiales bacterium]|nr:hypothetical protein [Verrucomicrobiales bacterium]
MSYTSPDKVFSLKGDRQAIIIDNQRYVGGVAWRQNMQTFDAAGFDWAPSSDFVLSYDYVWRVNRIFGSETFVPPFTDFKGDSHLINAKFKNLPVGTLTTYVYSLDLPNVATPGVFSSNTFGAHLTGDAFGDASFWLEYAHQVDAYGSPFSYAANYVHGYLSSPIFGLTGKIGHEYLGSDNGRAFQTPLGTNHAFNGFADAFLVTPAGGLNDFYASIGKKFDCGLGLTGFYHYFWDDGFDISRGQEIDVVATMPLGKGFTALAKGAFLWGQGAQPDVTRVSLEVNYKY